MTVNAPYRVKQTTTTTGATQPQVMNAANGAFRAFSTAFANGATVRFCVEDSFNNFEIWDGTFNSASNGTLTPVTFVFSTTGSAITWGVGTRNIFPVQPPAGALYEVTDASGTVSLTVEDWGRVHRYTGTGDVYNALAPGSVPPGYSVTLKNAGTGAAMVFTPASGLVEGAATYSVPPGEWATFFVNAAGTGYNVMAGFVAALSVAPPTFDFDVLHGTAGSLDSRLTFARASSGTYWDITGLLQTASSNVARFDYDPVVIGQYNGLRLDPSAATNYCLWCRDLTNAVWVASNVTVAKNATGIDGTSTSASTLTATAPNGTVTQSVTLASAVNVLSLSIKRSVGTGTIKVSLDNGATFSDVTSAINSSTFTRVPATPGLVQTLANPQIQIQIGTSGDAIIVDYVQMENAPVNSGAQYTHPILTTSATATRAAETLLVLPSQLSYNPTSFTWLIDFGVSMAGPSTDVLSWGGNQFNSDRWRVTNNGSNTAQWRNSANCTGSATIVVGPGVTNRVCFTQYQGVGNVGGNASGMTSSASLPLYQGPIGNGFYIGGGSDVAPLWAKRVRFWNFALSSIAAQTLNSSGAPS